MKPILEIQNIAKKYRLQHLSGGYVSLRERMVNLLKFKRDETEEFWAIDDVSFEVQRGESVGIIGRNGAGKSTLLKILSKITPPTKGRITARGRIASLLEVGTGFHPELTGRENIFFNGSLLGMKNKEVITKFDAIVDFSGVENFLDTPIKHYSSGMQLRLAFSVAAFLEPEILIVDEVLAVGDAEFQKKCLGKMDEASKTEGRTVLFVSHNLAAVSQLCKRGILLKNGKMIADDAVSEVIHKYISFNRSQGLSGDLINLDQRKGNGKFRIQKIKMLDAQQNQVSILKTGSPVTFEISLNKKVKSEDGAFRIDFAIDNEHDMRIGWFSTDVVPTLMKDEFKTVILHLPKFQFGAGTYYLTFFTTLNGVLIDYLHQGFAFDVEEGDFFNTGKTVPKSQTFIYIDHQITLN